METYQFWYHRLFRMPYQSHAPGFWGESTSTLNFCEEDYAMTYYLAEACNTISNLIFIYLGICGVLNCLRNGHSMMYTVSFFGYMTVGMSSILFHMTMKYPFQLADELSMIYATSIMSFATFSYGQNRVQSLRTFVFLTVFVVFVTVWYVVFKNPVFHQVAFAILMAATVFRAVYATGWELRPSLQKRNPQRCEQIMNELRYLVIYGTGIFIMGFLIWNLDNIHCDSLRHTRRLIQLPWGVVLEGHSWWHLMTGLAYCEVIWGIWLHRCLQAEEDEFEVKWNRLLFVPVPSVERVVDSERRDSGSIKGGHLPIKNE